MINDSFGSLRGYRDTLKLDYKLHQAVLSFPAMPMADAVSFQAAFSPQPTMTGCVPFAKLRTLST